MNNLVAAAQFHQLDFYLSLGCSDLNFTRAHASNMAKPHQNTLALPTTRLGTCVCWLLCLMPLSLDFYSAWCVVAVCLTG